MWYRWTESSRAFCSVSMGSSVLPTFAHTLRFGMGAYLRGTRHIMSVYAYDVSIFVSCPNDIEIVQETFERYVNVAWAKINRNKIYGLRLDAWKGGALLGPFIWADEQVTFLECGSDPSSSWRRTGQRYKQRSECRSGYGSEDGCPRRVGLRAVPLTYFKFILFLLSVLPLYKEHEKTIERLLSSHLRVVARIMSTDMSLLNVCVMVGPE